MSESSVDDNSDLQFFVIRTLTFQTNNPGDSLTLSVEVVCIDGLELRNCNMIKRILPALQESVNTLSCICQLHTTLLPCFFFFFFLLSILLFAFRPGQQPWLLDGFVFVCPCSLWKYAHKLLLHMIPLPLLTASARLCYSYFLDTWRSSCTWLLIHCSVPAQWHTFWLSPSHSPPTLSPLASMVAISLGCPYSPSSGHCSVSVYQFSLA